MNAPLAAVVIGASAGAIDALSSLLPELPANFPLPILVVVHIPPQRESAIVGLFRGKCRLQIEEAQDKELLQGGTVYFAPPDYHLLVEPDGRSSLSSEEPVMFSRPSIDVLFETAADAYGPALVGIVLTGAGRDGSRGLKKILNEGGIGLVQRPDTALVPDMPSAALQAAPAARSLTLPEIVAALHELTAS